MQHQFQDRSNWFGSLFRRIVLNITSMFDHKMATIGVSSSNYWILKVLWETDGITQKDLARRLSVQPASLTGMLDTMEEKGWVMRIQDSVDARIKRVFLTETGRELERKAADLIDECEKIICKGLTEEEKQQLKKMLKNILRNVDRANQNI